MIIQDVYRSRFGSVFSLLLICGLFVGGQDAPAADRTVFGELFTGDG